MTAHASPSPPGLLREPLLAAADDATAAAAQVTLAGALEPGDEWTTLFQAARHTADDLDLTWLRASLRDPA